MFYTWVSEEMSDTVVDHVVEAPAGQNTEKENGMAPMIVANSDMGERDFPNFQQHKEGKLTNEIVINRESVIDNPILKGIITGDMREHLDKEENRWKEGHLIL